MTRFGIKGLRAQNFAGGLMGQAAILNKRKTRKDFNGRNPRFKTISNPKDEGFTGEDLVDAFDFGQSLINFDRDKGNSLKNSQNQIEENSYRKVISPKMHMIRLSPVDDQNNSSSIHSRYPQ